MRFINEFQEGENIVGHYLCRKREVMKTKNGRNYMSLLLFDKTGSINTKVWNLGNNIQSFEAGDFIKVEGMVVIFNEELQFNVIKIRKSVAGEYLPADYIPTGEKAVSEIKEELLELVESINNKYLSELLRALFVENKQLSSEFFRQSAAKSMHHSYMGGLCEHTLSVAKICDFLALRYKNVNRDLLISAALLHDIGKIYELSGFPTNVYTDDGQLIGHIIIGYELIAKEIEKIEDFPHTLKSLLLHCILSHHGKYEYGSPKLPKIIEACILSYADITDAHIKSFEEALEKTTPNSNWTSYNRSFEGELRRSTI